MEQGNTIHIVFYVNSAPWSCATVVALPGGCLKEEAVTLESSSRGLLAKEVLFACVTSSATKAVIRWSMDLAGHFRGASCMGEWAEDTGAPGSMGALWTPKGSPGCAGAMSSFGRLPRAAGSSRLPDGRPCSSPIPTTIDRQGVLGCLPIGQDDTGRSSYT